MNSGFLSKYFGQNQTTICPGYFKTLKKPATFMKEPIKNQQFSGQQFDPSNFHFYWRTKVIYEDQTQSYES
jgi:hypothetical protein